MTGDPASDAGTAATSGAGLVRSSAAVGIGTALSRVTGLVRTVALAYALGRTVLADSYNLANTTPNIVYDLILGGVLSATLVPVFVARFERDDREGIDAVITVLVTVLTGLTIAAVVAAPWIFRIYTWAAGGNAAELERAGVPLLRMFLPQVLFYGLTALATALLNARGRFGVPAAVPVLNNVLVTAVLFWFAQLAGRSPTVDGILADTTQMWLLGAGTTAGIVLMTFALWPSLRRAGLRWRWRFDLRNPAVRSVVRLSGWTFGYVVANQVALAVVLALATKGDTAAVYLYAFQFFQLPYGLFAVSIMTTFTPVMASAVARNDSAALRDRVAAGLRLLTLIVLPSAVGMGVLARPLIVGLLGHGAFTGSAGRLTADVLAAFAVGLPGFSVYLFTLRAFYAMHDTRTPFLINLAENALNVVLGLALVGPYGVQGLAVSYSVAYTLAAVGALAALRRRLGRIGGRSLLGPVTRMAASAAAMGLVVVPISGLVGGEAGLAAALRVAVGVAVGVAVYAGLLVVMRVEEVRRIASGLRL